MFTELGLILGLDQDLPRITPMSATISPSSVRVASVTPELTEEFDGWEQGHFGARPFVFSAAATVPADSPLR